MGITTTGCGSTGTGTSGGWASMIMDSRTQSDTDVSTFLSATSISDPTQTQALYFLVGALKTIQSTISGSLWSRMTALYPFVGGNATAHSKDLKGSYNLANAGNATWTSGVTHNSNGVTGNGTTGYGDTGLVPSSVLTANTCHVCTYQRTSHTGNQGCYTTGFNEFNFGCSTSGNLDLRLNYLNLSPSTISSTKTTGCFITSRNSSQITKAYSSGKLIGSSSSGTDGRPTVSVYTLARNNNGTAGGFCSSNQSFLSIGSGLSDQDAINLNQIVQAYQTILGRQV